MHSVRHVLFCILALMSSSGLVGAEEPLPPGAGAQEPVPPDGSVATPAAATPPPRNSRGANSSELPAPAGDAPPPQNEYDAKPDSSPERAAPIDGAAPEQQPVPSYAHAPAGPDVQSGRGHCACGARKLPRRRRRLELSFGSAQKFFGQSVSDPTGIIRNRTIPVTTVSIFGEWLFHPYFSVMALFDLPLEPRSTLKDGQLQQEYVPPSLSGGIRVTAFQAYILEDTLVDGQFAALLGSTLADIGGDTVFPTLGWRLHLRDDEGLTLYAGTTFEFRLNRAALIYGIGHRF